MPDIVIHLSNLAHVHPAGVTVLVLTGLLYIGLSLHIVFQEKNDPTA